MENSQQIEEKEVHPKKPSIIKQNQIAGAIVIAGLLIAGAILLKGGEPNQSQNSISRELKINQKAFAECRTGETVKNLVQSQLDSGIRAGAKGTPYTVLLTQEGKKYVVSGAYPYEEMKKIIDGILAGNSPIQESKIEIDLISENEYLKGEKNAPIIAIEYSDPECPFSKRFHETMNKITAEYQGKVAWAFRFFPLDSIHKNARAESEAIACAGMLKGKEVYWQYLDKVFELTSSNDGLDLNLL